MTIIPALPVVALDYTLHDLYSQDGDASNLILVSHIRPRRRNSRSRDFHISHHWPRKVGERCRVCDVHTIYQ